MEAPKPSITIKFDGESPIEPVQIAAVLSAISIDYASHRKGHRLAVTRLSNGSLIIEITDWVIANWHYGAAVAAVPVSIAAAGNILIDFYNKVSGLLGKAKASPDAGGLFAGRRATGIRTVEKIAIAAIESKASVDLECRSPSGGTLRVSVSPNEAQRMRDAGSRSAHSAPPVARGRSDRTAEIEQAVLRLPSFEDQAQARHLVEMLVDLLVDTGSSSGVDLLVDRLVDAGYHELADVARERKNRRGRPGRVPTRS